MADRFSTRGKVDTLKFSKEVRLRVQHYFAGISEYRDSSSVELTYDGIPLILKELIPFIRLNDPKISRWVLTVLNFTRLIKTQAVEVLNTITDCSSADTSTHLKIYEKYLSGFIKFLRHKSRNRVKWKGNLLDLKG